MKITQILFLVLITTAIQAQNVVINELVARNVNAFVNGNCERNGCPDFIELHNTTSSNIDISNFFLSDDITNSKKWQIPAGTAINANGFLLIYGNNATSRAPLRANFRLASVGETLLLSDASGTEIQRVTYPAIQNDTSYGRLTNGSYTFFSSPSPEAVNDENTAFEYLDSNLTINTPSGLYPTALSVELSHTGPGTIYYTTDGTTPTTSSTTYSGPIIISSNTALRAIVISNSNLFSIVENRSYIIGATHKLPVVLLTSDNSTKTAVRRNKEVIDGRVEFNFIEEDGTVVINQYANFRESGNASRFVIPQLNGKVKANKVYGDGDFDVKMFPNKEIDEFDGLLLRNASQDWLFTHLRDGFISRLNSDQNLTNLPFEGYRPAVLYVNAIYQGIINVREDDDNDYVKHNFNLKEGEFKKAGRRSLFITPDAPLPNDRKALNSVIDFNSYTNIRILKNYSDLREDGYGWWEDLTGKTGQRYHYYVHDFDVIFGRRAGAAIDVLDPMDVSELLDSEIAANPEYRSEALQFVAASINHIYNTDRALRILDEVVNKIKDEIPAHAVVNARLNSERTRPFNNPPFSNINEWNANITQLRNNISNRIDTDIFNRIQTEYNLDTQIEVTYNSSDINQGFVRVHEIKIAKTTATGTYFSNIPLKLTAEALPGFRFVRWEGDVTGTSKDVAPIFSTNASVTAIFEPIPQTTNLAVINEVQGKNDGTIADENGEFDDWIEIYNPSATPINLAGLYFSDNITKPLKWQIPNTDASKTTVPANGYLLLWADNEVLQGENHLGFQLKGSDQVIITNTDAVTEKQRVVYTNINTDQSFGADTDGSTNFVVFDTPTPNAANSVTLGIEDEIFRKKSFSIYPNPTTANCTINVPTQFNNTLKWTIYDLNGNFLNSGLGNMVPMENKASGLYFITINEEKTLKIIKR